MEHDNYYNFGKNNLCFKGDGVMYRFDTYQ